MQIKRFQALAKPCSESGRVENHDYILQRHENQELSNSCQTLLRERTSQQTTTTSYKDMKIKSFQTPAKPCSESGRVSKTTTTSFKDMKIKSFHTPTKPCSESGRVSKTTTTSFKDMKSRAFKLLPHLAQRADESTRPLLHHSNMQTFGPMPNLAERTESQQDHDYIMRANQEL